MVPPKVKALKLFQLDSFVEGDKPVMWRGPMLGKLLTFLFLWC